MEFMEDAGTLERRLLERAEREGIPLSGTLELLPLCNLNCRMCYVRLSPAQQRRLGPIRTGEQWLELGRQMRRAGTLFLLLTGGEPLLHPDFREIYLGLQKMGMILTVNTNATLLDAKWADFFGRHKPRRINITLYGGGRDAYDRLCGDAQGFDKAVEAVRLLRSRGVDVKLASSITADNASDVDAMLALSRELEVPMRMDTYMMPGTRERGRPFEEGCRLAPEEAARVRVQALRQEMGEPLFRAYRQTVLEECAREDDPPVLCSPSCHGGRSAFVVTWQWRLRPCVVMPQPEESLDERDFSQAWAAVREKFQSIRYSPACGGCALRGLCRTCPAAALLETGSYLEAPEYLCRYARASARCMKEQGND